MKFAFNRCRVPVRLSLRSHHLFLLLSLILLQAQDAGLLVSAAEEVVEEECNSGEKDIQCATLFAEARPCNRTSSIAFAPVPGVGGSTAMLRNLTCGPCLSTFSPLPQLKDIEVELYWCAPAALVCNSKLQEACNTLLHRIVCSNGTNMECGPCLPGYREDKQQYVQAQQFSPIMTSLNPSSPPSDLMAFDAEEAFAWLNLGAVVCVPFAPVVANCPAFDGFESVPVLTQAKKPCEHNNHTGFITLDCTKSGGWTNMQDGCRQFGDPSVSIISQTNRENSTKAATTATQPSTSSNSKLLWWIGLGLVSFFIFLLGIKGVCMLRQYHNLDLSVNLNGARTGANAQFEMVPQITVDSNGSNGSIPADSRTRTESDMNYDFNPASLSASGNLSAALGGGAAEVKRLKQHTRLYSEAPLMVTKESRGQQGKG